MLQCIDSTFVSSVGVFVNRFEEEIATISQTKVILADEPTGNLDQNSGADVIQILERLVDKGITLIMVTHDPDMGRRARRQLHMIDGKLTGDRRDDHHGHA